MRGLVQEVTSLLAWVLAIAAVRFGHPLVTDFLEAWVGTEGGAAVLAFVLLFGGVFSVAKWGSRAMGQRSRASLVGGFDRGLGAGFGAVKGLMIATIGFMLVTLLYDIGYGDAQKPAWMTDSRSYPPGAWDNRPSQTIVTGVNAPAVLDFYRRTLLGSP